jgi:hypothetical protein
MSFIRLFLPFATILFAYSHVPWHCNRGTVNGQLQDYHVSGRPVLAEKRGIFLSAVDPTDAQDGIYHRRLVELETNRLRIHYTIE